MRRNGIIIDSLSNLVLVLVLLISSGSPSEVAGA